MFIVAPRALGIRPLHFFFRCQSQSQVDILNKLWNLVKRLKI